MQEWYSLAQRMILGSDTTSSPFTSDNKNVQHFFSKLSTQPSSRQLLQALAGLQWLRKLGKTFGQSLETQPSALETLPVCSAQTTALLRTGFQSRHTGLLVETFTLMQQHQQILPPDLLVDGLILAERIPALQQPFNSVCGKRGLWMAQQNPAWQFAAHADASELQGEPLLHHLQGLRVRQHPHFLQTVAALWPSLPARDRQKLIALIEPAPLHAEYAFLEQCLSDRSLSVRQLAVRARLKLQDATLLAACRNAASTFITITPGKLLRRAQLVITLPEHFDKTWETLGIQEKLEYCEPAGKLGRKSSWLHQCLALLPPQELLSAFKISAAEFLTLADKNDHAIALQSAWANAALLYDDAEALAALWQTLSTRTGPHWLQALLPLAKNACREFLLLETRHNPPEKASSSLPTVLNHLADDSILSAGFSEQLLEHLIRDIDNISYWYQGLQQRVDALAFVLDPQQIPGWIARLETNTPARLEGCLRWLLCRQQLHQEFSS